MRRDDATKNTRSGPEALLGVLAGVTTLYVAKGKKVVKFDLDHNRPDDNLLVAAMTGPTGNLRAPTLRQGKSLFVGFHEEMYAALRDDSM